MNKTRRRAEMGWKRGRLATRGNSRVMIGLAGCTGRSRCAFLMMDAVPPPKKKADLQVYTVSEDEA